ncbi:uncharacterized protein LOC124689616 [Lolium rigidum]|uniref:uncharacterized protein LOC124689616 n=1 Tax=Lolium rigidum TaxID=89674 RepID=UPI001F5D37DD|nr:uncharacterized protein LOC124689616 [Lolium rigidum]
MAIKKATRTKKPTYAAANASGCGCSMPAMAEMPPHGPGGAANQIQPPPPLPPGVYFSPTRDECLGFLNRRIAGDSEMADARGYIFDANVYGESPDALRRRHPPASIRGRGEHAWWFLSETRFQSKTAGGGASKRADRRVETGGYWRLEQSKERLKQIKERRLKRRKQSEEEEEDEADGVKNCFGFYVGRDDKTPWLMQEFTSANDDGAGKLGVPALYRVYVTPRATREQLTGVFAKEDDVKKGPGGNKKPARAMIPQGYFDRIASLLPVGSVRAVVQEHVHAPAPLPPAAPVQHRQYLGHYEQQQGRQYLGQYEQQQQGPCSVVAPPATPGLLGEFTAAEAPPPDNMSMSMVEFMGMFNEQPAGIVNEQPAETVKEGEPDWGYLPDIVDADVFRNFNTDEG